jgi:hypothetical protein
MQDPQRAGRSLSFEGWKLLEEAGNPSWRPKKKFLNCHIFEIHFLGFSHSLITVMQNTKYFCSEISLQPLEHLYIYLLISLKV